MTENPATKRHHLARNVVIAAIGKQAFVVILLVDTGLRLSWGLLSTGVRLRVEIKRRCFCHFYYRLGSLGGSLLWREWVKILVESHFWFTSQTNFWATIAFREGVGPINLNFKKLIGLFMPLFDFCLSRICITRTFLTVWNAKGFVILLCFFGCTSANVINWLV